MRKVISAPLSALLFASCADALHSHPFVGHPKDTASVKHDDGSVSTKLGAKRGSLNKHGDFVTTEGLFEPEKSMFDHISEAVFGPQISD